MKSIAAYAVVAGFFFVTLAMFVQGVLPALIPESRSTRVTRAVRTELGDVKWLRAEDLNVGMFLTGMRQQHFGVQHGWGRDGEARMPGFSIRSG